ncbi:MAG: hypothetical protein ACXVX3_02530 [Blastococcus sp.]
MTSSALPASWLPAPIARALGVQEPAGPRHLAPAAPPDAPLRIVPAGPELTRVGRHAEHEWSRELFDPKRDDIDAFDWLGFTSAQD